MRRLKDGGVPVSINYTPEVMLLSSHGSDWVTVLYAEPGYVAVVLPTLYQYASRAHTGIPIS